MTPFTGDQQPCSALVASELTVPNFHNMWDAATQRVALNSAQQLALPPGPLPLDIQPYDAENDSSTFALKVFTTRNQDLLREAVYLDRELRKAISGARVRHHQSLQDSWLKDERLRWDLEQKLVRGGVSRALLSDLDEVRRLLRRRLRKHEESVWQRLGPFEKLKVELEAVGARCRHRVRSRSRSRSRHRGRSRSQSPPTRHLQQFKERLQAASRLVQRELSETEKLNGLQQNATQLQEVYERMGPLRHSNMEAAAAYTPIELFRFALKQRLVGGDELVRRMKELEAKEHLMHDFKCTIAGWRSELGKRLRQMR